MSWLSKFVHWAEGQLKELWNRLPQTYKDTIEKAASAAGNAALVFVQAEAAKVISGDIKLNNVSALLTDAKGAAKQAGYTIGLDLARGIGQDVYMTFQQNQANPTPLVAGPNDPQDLHDQIAAANAATIAQWLADGKISPDVAASLTPLPAKEGPATETAAAS
ncbi:MAG: hypothetical protein GC190_22025 [Alphaproteobacteria bacterium]|nr:hypothetical protein [Alphaproteobacteria bacterium]